MRLPWLTCLALAVMSLKALTIFFIAAMTLVVSPAARVISPLRSPTATILAMSPTCLGSPPNCFMTTEAMIMPMAMATMTPMIARVVRMSVA
jgi:hypothetical protein